MSERYGDFQLEIYLAGTRGVQPRYPVDFAGLESGFDTIVYSREPSDSPRADNVRQFGATYVSTMDSSVDKIPAVVGPVDVIYEAVGIAPVAFGAVEALSPNGLLILTGIPAPAAPATVPLDRIMKSMVLNNQAIIGTVNAGRTGFALAIAKLEQAMYLVPDSVRSIITSRLPLDAAPDALRQPHGVKDIVHIRSL